MTDPQNADFVEHAVAVNVDYDEDGGMRSWAVETCRCDRPWRHGNAYLGGIGKRRTSPGQECSGD